MAENSYSSPAPEPQKGATGSGTSAEDAAHTEAENVRDLQDIPAIEVITRSIVMLMSASAEKLGLAEGTPRTRSTSPRPGS